MTKDSARLPDRSADTGVLPRETEDFVTMTIENQLFGISVLMVRDVLVEQKLTHVPLAPPEIAGASNLRGRIVTAIDVRRRLALPKREDAKHGMSIVVEFDGELYSLNVDSVGEVLTLPADAFDGNPSTLDAIWKTISKGVYRLEGQLMLVMDVAQLLDFEMRPAA